MNIYEVYGHSTRRLPDANTACCKWKSWRLQEGAAHVRPLERTARVAYGQHLNPRSKKQQSSRTPFALLSLMPINVETPVTSQVKAAVEKGDIKGAAAGVMEGLGGAGK